MATAPGAGVRVERVSELPAGVAAALVTDSERAGLRFVRRLADDWASGTNRFDRPGEALFIATLEGRVIGVCGLNVDPYATADRATADRVGRVRHLYVVTTHRRLGVGRRLVLAVIEAARGRFQELRLRTQNPAAVRLYEGLGFRPCPGFHASTHRLTLEDDPGSRGR